MQSDAGSPGGNAAAWSQAQAERRMTWEDIS